MKRCHACGESWTYRHTPTHRDACEGCGAALHCCLNCRFCDERASQWCTEPAARDERARTPDEANRCAWFVFADDEVDARAPGGPARENASSGLAEAFGPPPSNETGVRPAWQETTPEATPDLADLFAEPGAADAVRGGEKPPDDGPDRG